MLINQLNALISKEANLESESFFELYDVILGLYEVSIPGTNDLSVGGNKVSVVEVGQIQNPKLSKLKVGETQSISVAALDANAVVYIISMMTIKLLQLRLRWEKKNEQTGQ